MQDSVDSVADPENRLEKLDDALGRAIRNTGASAGYVYLMQKDQPALRLTVLSGGSRQLAAPWALAAPSSPFPVSDAVRERRLVWLGSREELARRYPRLGLVLPYDVKLAAAPVISDTTAWGGLVLLWPAWHAAQLSQAERDTVDESCRRMALLLKQAADSGHPVLPPSEPRLLSLSSAHGPGPTEALAAVNFAARLPGGCVALDLDGRITFITAVAADLVGATTTALLGARPWEVLPWLDAPVFQDSYRAAAFTHQPTSFTMLRPPDEWLSFHLFPDASGISVHITSTPTGQAPAPPPWQQPTPDAGSLPATGLYHLMHLAAALTEAIGVKDVVEVVSSHIVPAFGVQAVAIMTAEEGRLRIIGYRGYTAELMDRFDAAPLSSDTPAADVLSTGLPRFFATFAELQRAYPPAEHLDNMASWAFLPLIASGRTVGSLVLAYDLTRPFPTAERAVLTSLAGLIAQALDRARLYDTKHELARTLQTGLLPHTLPSIAGLEVAGRYLPATRGIDIGGDFYDLIRSGETSAAAAIGDVQGHNVTAAALMGQVRTAVHAHVSTGTSPGEVLARTNRLLTDLDPGLFTSCLCVHINLPQHSATLASAGHPPPILRHPDGRAEVLDLPYGLVLGVDPNSVYPITEIPLPAGSLLALYTDGLVETPGADIEDATVNLANHLAEAEEESVDALADRLLEHSVECATRNDDVALLLIRA